MIGIILVGYARSGKDTVADYIEEKYGWSKFVFSDCLVEELQEMHREVNKENMSIIGDKMREELGMDIVASLVFEKAEKSECEKAVFVGARSVEEVDYLRNSMEKAYVVSVIAEAEKRFERRSKQDAQGREDFFSRDERDVKNKGLKKVIEAASYIIENNSTLEELKKNVNLFIEKI